MNSERKSDRPDPSLFAFLAIPMAFAFFWFPPIPLFIAVRGLRDTKDGRRWGRPFARIAQLFTLCVSIPFVLGVFLWLRGPRSEMYSGPAALIGALSGTGDVDSFATAQDAAQRSAFRPHFGRRWGPHGNSKSTRLMPRLDSWMAGDFERLSTDWKVTRAL